MGSSEVDPVPNMPVKREVVREKLDVRDVQIVASIIANSDSDSAFITSRPVAKVLNMPGCGRCVATGRVNNRLVPAS
jgi:hypothetical protein